jgi:outer membrane protein TolC
VSLGAERSPCAPAVFLRRSAQAALLAATWLVIAPLGAQPSAPAPSQLAAPAAAAVAVDGAQKEPPAEQAPSKNELDLPRILALADRHHPQILESRAKLAMVRAQLDEAHWAPFSQFRATGGVALVPEIQGSHIYSPNTDVSLTSSLGMAWRVGVEGVLPLWTFGKIGHLWDAAAANVKVHEAAVEKERDLVRLEVRRAFYGLQLARDAKLLLVDVRKQLEAAERSLTEKVEAEEADPVDLLRLQTFSSELLVREAEADRFVQVALAGLRFFTGLPELDVLDLPLVAPSHELLGVERYLEAAVKHRPELAQARAGLMAREAQVRLAEASFYPDVGVGLSAGLSAAPEIDDQLNPFVNDPGNFFRYGAAIVFQWNLDFLPRAAKLRQAEAELSGMRALSSFATGGVEAEVRSAHAEVVDWQRRLAAYTKSVQYARRWLIRVQQGIDVGTVEDKELLEPAKAYAMGRFNVLNATMELDLALAKLARATGWDAIAPDGMSRPYEPTP